MRMRRFVRPLLRLYPEYWRLRYGEEFAALLAECPPRPGTILDVLLGALDAHIDPQDTTGRIVRMLDRPRRSAIVMFWAYIAFVLAGLGFFNASEDDIRRLLNGHSDLAAAYWVVQAGAGLALLAVLAGGVPVALAALRRAWERRRRDIALLFAVPPLALALWVGWIALLVRIFASASARAGHAAAGFAFLSLGGLFLLAAIASTAAVTIAVSRSALGPDLYRFALRPAAAATALMAIVLTAVVFWGLALRLDVPSYFATPVTPFGVGYRLAWLADVTVMAAATLVAALALVRGWQAPRATPAAHVSSGATGAA
jgi:hypothetical protein